MYLFVFENQNDDDIVIWITLYTKSLLYGVNIYTNSSLSRSHFVFHQYYNHHHHYHHQEHFNIIWNCFHTPSSSLIQYNAWFYHLNWRISQNRHENCSLKLNHCIKWKFTVFNLRELWCLLWISWCVSLVL